jgi:hypothetical protein
VIDERLEEVPWVFWEGKLWSQWKKIIVDDEDCLVNCNWLWNCSTVYNSQSQATICFSIPLLFHSHVLIFKPRLCFTKDSLLHGASVMFCSYRFTWNTMIQQQGTHWLNQKNLGWPFLTFLNIIFILKYIQFLLKLYMCV